MTIDSTRTAREPDKHAAGVESRPHGPAPARPKERRRPLVIAAMVALVCLGALVSAYAYLSTSETQDVLAVRETVNRGEVIGDENLMSVRVGLDPALDPVDTSQLEDLVGQRAAVDLSAGSLVTPDSVTDAMLPVEGESIVGVSLTSAMMPSQAIYAGDTVRVVATPGDQGEVREGAVPVSVEATVVGVRTVPETGETVVDVAVPETQAAELAARAATRKVALVLDSRAR